MSIVALWATCFVCIFLEGGGGNFLIGGGGGVFLFFGDGYGVSSFYF